MSYQVLIVDDEPDMHAMTRMVLKSLKFQNESVQMMFFQSGAELIEHMAAHPEAAVILLDVVMEHDHAGLDAVRTIRQELGNELVRILLRTGQPGQAPEREVIEAYDIDGYLSKSEMTSQHLFTAVRTALKHYVEHQKIQRHRDLLWHVTQAMGHFLDLDTLPECLQQLVETVALIVPSDFCLLYLEATTDSDAHPHLYFHGPDALSDQQLTQKSVAILDMCSQQPDLLTTAMQLTERGVFLAFQIPKQAVRGFLFVERQNLDELEQQVLHLLMKQAAFALSRFYS